MIKSKQKFHFLTDRSSGGEIRTAGKLHIYY